MKVEINPVEFVAQQLQSELGASTIFEALINALYRLQEIVPKNELKKLSKTLDSETKVEKLYDQLSKEIKPELHAFCMSVAGMAVARFPELG